MKKKRKRDIPTNVTSYFMHMKVMMKRMKSE